MLIDAVDFFSFGKHDYREHIMEFTSTPPDGTKASISNHSPFNGGILLIRNDHSCAPAY